MPRPRISPEMIRLYDDFTHRTLDRRALMAAMTKLAGSTAAALSVLSLIEASPAGATEIDPADPRVSGRRVEWPIGGGQMMKGYLAVPKPMASPLPAVIVIHENRGLNAYIEDVARRTALAGFIGLAPDFLSLAGGTPTDEDKARQLISGLDPAQTIGNALATIDWLRRNPRVAGKIGAIGFCWGGGLVNRLAVAAGERLDAGVAFYGPAPAPTDAVHVKAHMLLHYAGRDERVNAGAPAWVDALKKAGTDVRDYTYPNVEHAFHNDTSAARYNADAAKLSWDRTIDFLKIALRPESARRKKP